MALVSMRQLLDHAATPDVCQRSIQMGFSSVMMDGSSSVPQEWLKVINEFGGEIPETYGVPLEEIQEGIKHGVRKVNIDTDLRLASTGSIRRYLAQNSSEFDPRKYFTESLKAMKEIVLNLYEAFGTTGNASRIKPNSLDAMSQLYLSGALDPKTS